MCDNLIVYQHFLPPSLPLISLKQGCVSLYVFDDAADIALLSLNLSVSHLTPQCFEDRFMHSVYT